MIGVVDGNDIWTGSHYDYENKLTGKVIKMYGDACDNCTVGYASERSGKVIYYKPSWELGNIGISLCFSCQKEEGVNFKREYKEQCKRLGVPEKILRRTRKGR